MLVINKLKPFYKEKNIIRMGNFKNNAKEIRYEDENFYKIFEYIKEPISKKELINKISNETKISKEEIKEIINVLIKQNFIIDNDKYEELLTDKKLNRQKLYFSMANDNVKNWKLVKEPNIIILGLGGIGANVAVLLSRSGFKNITLVDYDKVEESNLIRQLAYDSKDINKLKTECLKNKIKTYENNIKTINKKIEKEEDIETEIKESDFVICTLDKPLRIIRRIINNLCVKNNKPVLFSGFSEASAIIGPFVVPEKSACLNCILKKRLDAPLNNVDIIPSYGPLCLFISSIVSNEVINYYYKFNKNNLINKTLMFNMLTYEVEIIKWKKKKECEVCHDYKKHN